MLVDVEWIDRRLRAATADVTIACTDGWVVTIDVEPARPDTHVRCIVVLGPNARIVPHRWWPTGSVSKISLVRWINGHTGVPMLLKAAPPPDPPPPAPGRREINPLARPTPAPAPSAEPRRRLPGPDPIGLEGDDAEQRFALLEPYDEPIKPGAGRRGGSGR